MRKRLVGLLILAVACTLVFAAVTTDHVKFTNGITVHVLSQADPQCVTEKYGWGDAPYVSLSWNAYGDSGSIYRVGIQWADHTSHFDVRTDTIMTCTLWVDYTKAAASRHTEELSRRVSQYGRAVFIRDTLSGALPTAYIDTVAFVPDQR